MSTSLRRLPNELLKAIWDLLEPQPEKGAFVLTCRRFYYTFNTYLYRHAVHHDLVRVSGWAARRGREDTMEKLVEEGLDVKGRSSMTPLFEAARYGQKNIIRFLIRNGLKDLSMKGHGRENKGPALASAVHGGQEGIVRLLLEHHADTEEENANRETPLLIAARCGNEQLVSVLLEGGADPDTMECFDRTPLWHAINGNHLEIVKLLVDRLPKCRIDRRDARGATALFRAVELNNEQAVRILLRAGAQVDPVRKSRPRFPGVAESIRAQVNELLGVPASQNIRTPRARGPHASRIDNTQTALQVAIKNQLTNMVRLILDEGCVHEPSGAGAVTEATNRGNEIMVQLLLERGINPIFDSALAYAAQRGFEGIARRLLDAGASPNRPPGPMWTPLEWAINHSHYAVIALLLERGADLPHQKQEELLSCSVQTKNNRLLRALLARGVDINQVKDQRLRVILKSMSQWRENNGHGLTSKPQGRGRVGDWRSNSGVPGDRLMP